MSELGQSACPDSTAAFLGLIVDQACDLVEPVLVDGAAQHITDHHPRTSTSRRCFRRRCSASARFRSSPSRCRAWKRSPDALSYIRNEAGPVGPGQQPPTHELQPGCVQFRWRGRSSRSAWSAIAEDACARCPALQRDAGPRRRRAGCAFPRPPGSGSATSRARRPHHARSSRRRHRRRTRPTLPHARQTSTGAAAAPALDLKPLRHRLVENGVVTRVQRFRHRAHDAPARPRRDALTATSRHRRDVYGRQLVVDVSMQLVFGNGNFGVGHISGLCSISLKKSLCITLATISPAAARWRSPSKRSFDMGSRARKPGHYYGTDRHSLDVGDLAVAQSFQHHQQQHRALLLHQRRQRPRESVAAFRLGAAGNRDCLSSSGCECGRLARDRRLFLSGWSG